MIACRLHLRFLLLFLLALFFYGCMPDGSFLSKQTRKQVYIDANLLFEISYPEEWARTQEPITLRPLAKETTTWRINDKNNKNILLKLSILSLAKERNPNGYKGLEKHLLEQNSNLLITGRKLITVPAGPAQKLSGITERETFEIWLYLGKKRHYIINCSASTSVFEQYRPMFNQIADSFKAIE